MLMLVSYDVSTVTAAGRRRLHRVAKACEDYGVRVQNSVFECYVDWSQWLTLKDRLEKICNLEVDSLRYYNLGNSYHEKVIHVGAKPTVNPMEDALLL